VVPKSVTLNDLERRNNSVKTVTMRYFTEFGSLQAHYVKVVEDTPTLSAAECSPKNLVFSGILFIAIFAEVTVNVCVMYRRSLTSITYSLLFSNSTATATCKSDFTIFLQTSALLDCFVFRGTCTMSS